MKFKVIKSAEYHLNQCGRTYSNLISSRVVSKNVNPALFSSVLTVL